MTARRRMRALLLLLAAVLAGCGTLTTTGNEVVEASAGVVTSADGTATVSLPVGLEDAAAETTLEPLDLERDGDAPGPDANGLAEDILEGAGTAPTGLDPEDLRAFELGLYGGWRVGFSEPWFEEGDTYGIGSRPVFGLGTEFWKQEFSWPPRLLPFDVSESEGEQEPADQEESGGTPVPVPIVVRVDEEGAATVLPGTAVTPHPAGTAVTASLDGSGTVAAFGGTVAVSITPERVRALVGEVIRTRVTLHIAEDFGGTFRDSGQSAVATGSANVRPLTASVQLDNRDDDSAELEFVCTEPGLGRFGVTLDIVSVSMITFGQFPTSMFEDHGVAMRLGVVECLDPNDPRLPESVTDDLQPVFGLPRIDDTVDPSELPTAEPQALPRPPVEADRPPSLVGPCDGRAILDDGTVIDPSSSAGVYVVPRVGDAFYLGSVDAQVTEPRGFAGSVVLHLPPPLAAVPIGSWSGTGEGTSATGVQAWDLAGPVLPPGVRIPLEAVHRDDAAGHCSASLVVAFEGGFTDSPYGPAGAAATLIGLAGLGLAGLPKRT